MNSCESTPVATPLFAEQKLGDNVQRDRAVLHAAGFRNQASDHDAYDVCEKRILVPGQNTKIVFARISAVASAAASTVPRRSSSMGRVTMDPLTTKPSSWPYEKKVGRATP